MLHLGKDSSCGDSSRSYFIRKHNDGTLGSSKLCTMSTRIEHKDPSLSSASGITLPWFWSVPQHHKMVPWVPPGGIRAQSYYDTEVLLVGVSSAIKINKNNWFLKELVEYYSRTYTWGYFFSLYLITIFPTLIDQSSFSPSPPKYNFLCLSIQSNYKAWLSEFPISSSPPHLSSFSFLLNFTLTLEPNLFLLPQPQLSACWRTSSLWGQNNHKV